MPGVVLGYDGSHPARVALEVTVGQAFGDRLVSVFADEPPGRSAGEEFREHRRAPKPAGHATSFVVYER